jgi:hypothetical protein
MSKVRRSWLVLLPVLGAALGVVVGCSDRPSRLSAPGIPGDAPQQAIELYDGDGDGAIGGVELDKSPPLKSGLKRADGDGNGQLTADEIASRIAAWKNSGLALSRLAVTVQKGGQKVEGAEVKLVPEPFLGEGVKAASGTTDSDGVAHLRISDDPDESGVHLGYYRIEVSKKGSGGKEILPASNNTSTQHGVEVAPDDPNMGGFTVKLLDK